MAKNDIKTTDNPKLKTRPVKGGSMLSLFLAYYLGSTMSTDPATGKVVRTFIRKEKNLNLCIYAKPTTPTEKAHNQQTLLQAEIMREEERKKLLNGQGFNFDSIVKAKADFFEWLDDYCKAYTKKNAKVVFCAMLKFKSFIAESPKYKQFANVLPVKNLNADMMASFAEFLKANHRGEGANSYWQVFRKAVKVARREGFISSDYCDGIVVEIDKATQIKKEMLTIEEANHLLSCRPSTLNVDIYRAFDLTLRYSPAFCDVAKLTWGNIKDVEGSKRLQYERSKTHVAVDVALDADMLEILGEPGAKGEKLFPRLPKTIEGANIALRKWCEYAGIEKHITWHCGRHSFCSNAMAATNDPISTAAIAGHANPGITLKVYSHAIEDKKQNLTAMMAKAFKEAAAKQGEPQEGTEASPLDNMSQEELKTMLSEILKRL